MDSENGLRQELAELNLLLRGLAQVPAFPADLLKLISGKVESISRLSTQLEDQRSSVGQEDVSPLLTETVDVNQSENNGQEDFKSDFFIKLEKSEDSFVQVLDMTSHEPKSYHESESSPQNATTRINEQVAKLRLIDLTKYLTLNDRFRFQREFFENDSQKMSEVFSAINKTKTMEEALDYFRGVCSVDESTDCFKDFCVMLQLHFANEAEGNPSN